ncbi:hypothetical protein BGZ74_010978 [Mortierella antarctica]|nr:hypothetical protein BGZ74_010978 [Mortierella antarctica]
MILRLLPLLAILHVALGVYYTEDRPSYGEITNSSIYSLHADGDILIPDRTTFIKATANATAEAKELTLKHRKNGRLAAAANQPSEIVTVCVGVAGNPTRTRIFRDMASCDKWGWKTLYVFQAFRNYDAFMAPEAMCVGHHNDPERSMFFDGEDCNKQGWTHDFVFWVNDCPWFEKCKGRDVFQHNTQIHLYEAFNPHRMMIAPGYDGRKYGWTYLYSFAYFAHYYVPSAEGYRFLASQRNRLFKRQMNSYLAESYRRVIFDRLISCWSGNAFYNNIPRGALVDWDRCRAVRDAAHGDAETYRTIQIYFAGPVHGEYNVAMVRLELRLQNRVWGAVNFPVGEFIGAQAIMVELRHALSAEYDLSVIVNNTREHMLLDPTPGEIRPELRRHPFLNPGNGMPPMIYGGYPPGGNNQ